MSEFVSVKKRAPIILLPAELRNQIAAGEVVDRPAGIIKELLENSLDAGALRLDISLEQGGLAYLAVRDDGRGIPAEELALAVTSHATSKLRSLSDLMAINTLGFRGEALPSIGSVSVLRVTSAPAGEAGEEPLAAAFIELSFGAVSAQGAAALDRGTLVEVRELFANIPARLKFLKGAAAELKRCREVVERLALYYRDAAFRLYSEGRELCNFPAGRSLAESLAAVWPPAIVEAMRPVEFTSNGISISGLAGDPATAQAKSDRIFFYINGRLVQDRTLLAAVRQAYKGRLLGGEYPQAALFIDMPCDAVDVNVHPSKSEVRFRDERALFSTVLRAVEQALSAFSLDFGPGKSPAESPAGNFNPRPQGFWGLGDEPASIGRKLESGANSLPGIFSGGRGRGLAEETAGYGQEDAAEYLPPPQRPFPDAATEPRSAPNIAPDSAPEPAPAPVPEEGQILEPEGPSNTELTAPSRQTFGLLPELNYLGQIAGTYLVAGLNADSLLLLDQHAVHEAVLYARLRARGTSGESRPLALPLSLSLHSAEAEVLDERWADLAALGFKLSRAGALGVDIEGAPPDLSAGQTREFLRELLSGQVEGGLEELWAMMACKAAVKAKDALTGDEARELLRQWAENPAARYCPHGRPTAVTLSRVDLEKLFKRRV